MITYKCTRWPYQKQLAKELDKMQNKMIASLVREPRIPDESSGDYVRRRSTSANALSRRAGKWSRIWGSRVISWEEHMKRPRNGDSLCARLYEFYGASWLQDQRLLHGTSAVSGRTRTRVSEQRWVAQRWQLGVQYAKAYA